MEKAADTTIHQMEDMSDKELEAYILNTNNSAASIIDARFVLGKMMAEGSNPNVQHNETKGLNWIKEASKAGHIGALEFKTYWDIRFDRKPNLEKIKKNLELIMDKCENSARACNTLAEFNHAQASSLRGSKEEDKKAAGEFQAQEAAKLYQQSADQDDIIGAHWLGVFYHEGFGVAKNLGKAIEYLTKGANAGNGQSMYQLFLIHSGREGQDQKFKDPQTAYAYLLDAIYCGVTYFEDAKTFFKENYTVLAPVFLKNNPHLSLEIKGDENKADICARHDCQIDENKVSFSAGLGKDRLYHRPCGFLNDQQIWLVGVLVTYFQNSVLRFDHKDFLKALRMDLGPVLGDLGLWVLKCKQDEAKAAKDNELKKKLQVMIDIVEKYLESGLDVLSQEKKYHFVNKYSPKKCPDQQVKRENLKHIYSWQHYAPLLWFEHLKKIALNIKNEREGKVSVGKNCTACQAPEGSTLKHKVCSACKQAFYCSAECQKVHWKQGHKEACKELKKNIPKAMIKN